VSLRRNAIKQLRIGDRKLLAALLMIIIVLHETLFEVLEASFGMARKSIVASARPAPLCVFLSCANS